MLATTIYIVKSGDWLAKIAEEHGSTVSAIWNHPENAEHRALRGSPDVLYPDDVLHIPAASVASLPVEPPVAPELPAMTGPEAAPWPYEPVEESWDSEPTWDCPEGVCACHPVEEDEPRHAHVIVFHDPQGKRMPLARCRVYEQGRLITREPAITSAAGELTIDLRASTSTLRVEWAPPDLPVHDFMPYRKRYHVKLGENRARATDLRLSNIGFSSGRRRQDNVTDYQRAYGEVASGDHRDIELEVLERHDEGKLPMFPPTLPPDSTPDATPTRKSFFASPSRLAPGLGDSLGFVGAAFVTQQQGSSSKPGGGQGTQGAVVPNAGHVWLMVGLEPGVSPLILADITARLRPLDVPGLSAAQKDKLVKPSMPGVFWEDGTRTHVVFGFLDVPVGSYAAMAHIAHVKGARVGYAMGSAEIDVKMGLLTPAYVGAVADRPILTVADPLLDLDVPMMQRRRKVLATVFKNFPQAADLRAATRAPPPPYSQGDYQKMPSWNPQHQMNSCAPVNTSIMEIASGSGHLYGTALVEKHPGFVEYKPGLVPSVGDSFYLETAPGSFGHCGIVIQSSLGFDGLWLTADGGQPDRTSLFQKFNPKNGSVRWRRYYEPPLFSEEGAYIVPRLLRQSSADPNKAMLINAFIFPGITLGGGESMRGWGDITHPKVTFRKSAYDKDGSEADYRALKERALAIPDLVRADRDECARIETQDAGPATQPAPAVLTT
jgi:LysM domain-containing protein